MVIRTAFVPNDVIAIGSTNVPKADAIRLIAEQNPVPDARSSVGNISAGYTYCRVAPMVNTNTKLQKHITSTALGALLQSASISRGMAAMAYVPTRRVFLGTLSMMITPTIPPNRLNTLRNSVTKSSFSICKAARICGAKVKIGKKAITAADQNMQTNNVFFQSSFPKR